MKDLCFNISDRKSLLSFILTCRTFAEPGLNMLWRRLDNLFSLALAFQPNVNLHIDGDGDTPGKVVCAHDLHYLIKCSKLSCLDYHRFHMCPRI